MVTFSSDPVLRPWPARTWSVVQTRSRAERALEACAGRDGIPAFLPCLKRPSRRRDRRVIIEEPMFPGYLFAALGAGDLGALYRSRHVAGVLPATDEGRLLDDLLNIRIILKSEAGPVACRYLREGRRVRIVVGPLRGVEGRIDRRRKRGILVLSVDDLFRSIAVEVSEDAVESVG